MSLWNGSTARRALVFPGGLVAVILVLGLVGSVAAQPAVESPVRGPTLVIAGEPEVSTIYADGSRIMVETSERWKLVCGSNLSGVSEFDLRLWADRHYLEMAAGSVVVLDSGRDAGLDLVFNIGSSVPTAARPAITRAEQYLEGLFGDAVTVTLNISFQDMGGGGVIGATSPAYVNNVAYSTSRNGLINGMDDDDVIQTWLPTGSTVPVRYNGNSSAVTNESVVQWTKANYKAAIGTVSGSAASITFNTQFPFDYDPSNGISSGQMSFVDVLIHEVGHALGFVSAADWTYSTAVTSLDLYRFQRSGTTYNPGTYEQFQTFPRLVDYNTPEDAHISDIITNEYRMSDGDPYQASHFREQSANWIGLMDPAFAYGETHYPNYFTMADINMFDAIGWDYPPCDVPQFLQQPVAQTVCIGGQAEYSVQVDITAPAYQWRVGATPLVDDGVHIFGAQTATLRIVNVTPADASNAINCFVTNTLDGCTNTSNYAALTVKDPVTIVADPQDLTIHEGENVLFTVTASGGEPLSYRWRKDGVPLENGGNVYFADTNRLVILYASPRWNGMYDCVVSNLCGDRISNAARLTVIPDSLKGDLNCDGLVDFGDINPFVMAISNPALYEATYPGCPLENRDINEDGRFDFGDINPFVALLTNP